MNEPACSPYGSEPGRNCERCASDEERRNAGQFGESDFLSLIIAYRFQGRANSGEAVHAEKVGVEAQ